MSVLNQVETFLNLDETVKPNRSGAVGESRGGNWTETSLIYLDN